MRRHSTMLAAILLAAILGSSTAMNNSPPRIIKQPPTDELLFKVAQQNKESDKPFIIECEADGQPEPEYSWIKNGKKFDWQAYDNRMLRQPGRGTLVITSPKDEDLGQYQCFASNEFGVATSNSVFVRKAELNAFKDEGARGVVAVEGEPFSMQCEAPDGWPKPTVNWLLQSANDAGIRSINNSRMTLDPEGTLWFSNVTREDANGEFWYSCSATSVFRNEYKIGNKILLDVKQMGVSAAQNRYPPKQQYVTRKNEVGLRGKRVELYCIFGGTPLPQTVWSKDNKRIEWNDRITQGNYGKSLVIRHVSFEDAGKYTCDVSNGVGNAQSYTIDLKINSVPYFTLEPEIQNAAEEEEVTFKCEAAGHPEPTIQWIFNGKPIAQAADNPRRTVTNNYIRIVNLEKKDTGNYGCNATNSLGYVYKDVYLNVLALQPEIQVKPQAEAITVNGRNITLTCRVFGAPKPQVKWRHNENWLTGGRYNVLPSGDLSIDEVTYADSGTYTCLAVNKFGNATAQGSLVVKERTRITQEPQNYEVAAGQSATFRCNEAHDDTLDLQIIWQKDGQAIDFEAEARFVKTNDNSLTIAKTMELDSGEYTCVARTLYDEATAKANLIVQDVPNAPRLVGISCQADKAEISWQPQGDNRSPILHYTIQFNTSFTPASWDTAYEKVPSTDFSFVVQMSPWANYTYRVIAFNKIGPSPPSEHSEACTTQPDVPYKNPENVVGQGTEPNNLFITWTPMPEIEHNAPNFQYRVSWKRDIPAAAWENKDIYDWRQSNLLIPNQETFVKYHIKVLAINEAGESNVAAEEVIGYSGEDRPLEAPTNFSMLQVTSATNAYVAWNPVSPESVRGHFKGYKIQTWTDKEGEEGLREIHAIHNDALVTQFKPDSKNYARVLAYNGRFNGPPSATIDFDTPEGVPSSVQSLEAYPLGSSAFWVTWKKPLHPNGKLTGYKIYYEVVKGSFVGERREYDPHITDPRITSMKMAALKPNSKYRISITATTKMGEGTEHYIEKSTLKDDFAPPSPPTFNWEQIPSPDGSPNYRINWVPNIDGRSGSHFFTKYRVQGESKWLEVQEETVKDYQELSTLEPDTVYEVRVTSVDGHYQTDSPVKIIDTSDADGPIMVRNESLANAGWFIGMMLALAIIILLFIILCIIRRNRGGKYDVHDRELANGRRDYPDDGGFHEYSQPLDNKSAGRQSVSSANKPGVESDTDSMAEYGDGDTGQFTEDGSFIGQYVPGKLQPPVSPQPLNNTAAAHQQPQQQQPQQQQQQQPAGGPQGAAAGEGAGSTAAVATYV
ncbi:neuroglian isoform X1 [Drosophila sulfurigaster albostrigata]|uniref:neuroglian isoform X1 n=1 Tax=Drosophila sulfurigaster albostrigata TaxID=89887 RepID=UPI002D21DDEC|nr:neuroglian isoform X1 [Drosophila sulfurigaster albostrigata]